MLETRSKLPIATVSEGFEQRVGLRRPPSFGLGSLKSRKGLLRLSTIVFLALGLLYVLQRPTTYTASSQLLVYIKQIQTGADLAILPGRADLPLVQSQIELLRSGNVLGKLVEALQLDKDSAFLADHSLLAKLQAQFSSDTPALSGDAAFGAAIEAVRRKLAIRQVGTSHMITVQFTAADPERAAQIVNKLITVYLQELTRASDAGSSKAPALREIYQNLGPSAYIVSEAEPPIRADGPAAPLIVLAAGLIGLAVAAAAALLLDAANDTIRNARQVEYALGLECLAVIGTQAKRNAVGDAAGFTRALPDRALRRMLAAVMDASRHGLSTVGVTSAMPGEGKTTLAMGLALALKASGKRVLVIDACPENPAISRWAVSGRERAAATPGATRAGALVEARAGLDILPLAERGDGKAGSIPPAWLEEALHDATGAYDFVIVDMPALAAGPDVRAAARSLDGFVLVVKWGATESELTRQALRSSGEARPRFLGAALNMADGAAMKRYGDAPLLEASPALAS